MLQSVPLNGFRFGLDLGSSLSEVRRGFTPNASNFAINELGGVEKVLGYSALATTGAQVRHLFAFERSDGVKRVIAATDTAWYSIDSGGTATAIRTGMAATVTPKVSASFTVSADKLYGMDDENALHSWDGVAASTTAVPTGPNVGRVVGVWDGRMYTIRASNQMRVEWSDKFNFSSWPGNYVEVSAPGSLNKIVDAVVFVDGMILFTANSMLWLQTPGAPQYVVSDPSNGLTSRESLAVGDGRIWGVTKRGVFMTDGRGPVQLVSELVRPVFDNAATGLAGAAGAWLRGKYLASFHHGSSGAANDITLEAYSQLGRLPGDLGGGVPIMANDYPMGACAVTTMFDGTPRLVFVDASDPTKVRRGYRGGDFNGSPISCWYELAPTNLGSEQLRKRLYRLRVTGRGALVAGVKVDYRASTSDARSIGFDASAAGLWDSAVWDSSVWGGYEVKQGSVRLPVAGREFGFIFTEAGALSAQGRPVMGTDVDNIGGAALYVVEPHYKITRRDRS